MTPGQQTFQQSAECIFAYVHRESDLSQVHCHTTEPIHFACQTAGSLHFVELGAGDSAWNRPNFTTEPASEQRGQSGQEGKGGHVAENLKEREFIN